LLELELMLEDVLEAELELELDGTFGRPSASADALADLLALLLPADGSGSRLPDAGREGCGIFGAVVRPASTVVD
jgi:hypothetical protein